jgi:hypothetical protein
MSKSLHTTIAAEANLDEGQMLLDEQTLIEEYFLIFQAGSRRSTVLKTPEENLEPRRNRT